MQKCVWSHFWAVCFWHLDDPAGLWRYCRVCLQILVQVSSTENGTIFGNIVYNTSGASSDPEIIILNRCVFPRDILHVWLGWLHFFVFRAFLKIHVLRMIHFEWKADFPHSTWFVLWSWFPYETKFKSWLHVGSSYRRFLTRGTGMTDDVLTRSFAVDTKICVQSILEPIVVRKMHRPIARREQKYLLILNLVTCVVLVCLIARIFLARAFRRYSEPAICLVAEMV